LSVKGSRKARVRMTQSEQLQFHSQRRTLTNANCRLLPLIGVKSLSLLKNRWPAAFPWPAMSS